LDDLEGVIFGTAVGDEQFVGDAGLRENTADGIADVALAVYVGMTMDTGTTCMRRTCGSRLRT